MLNYPRPYFYNKMITLIALITMALIHGFSIFFTFDLLYMLYIYTRLPQHFDLYVE